MHYRPVFPFSHLLQCFLLDFLEFFSIPFSLSLFLQTLLCPPPTSTCFSYLSNIATFYRHSYKRIFIFHLLHGLSCIYLTEGWHNLYTHILPYFLCFMVHRKEGFLCPLCHSRCRFSVQVSFVYIFGAKRCFA